ncbi:uncharacterized protein [Leptinotarsa decemlineata]|uniref:uncharacterized protein n=1 Tax=Leptinotarsa decemlineata TaxID=7539 RepID=UPI003D309904
MDVDVDDLDLDNDEIKGFLKHKLMELKANNAKISQTISERKKHIQKLVEINNDEVDEESVSISPTWKKLFNGKYSLGFTIQNNGTRPLTNMKVFLKWTLSKSISYEVNTVNINTDETTKGFQCNDKFCQRISENVYKSEEIQSLGYIVVVLDFPKFIKNLEVEITGNITYKTGRDDREHNLAVPKVDISPLDATNRQVVSDLPLSEGSTENLLSAVFCSTRTDLVMVLPQDFSSKLDSAFEIHCALTAVTVPACCRKYFWANRVSPIFNNSIVEVHAAQEESSSVYRCTVYSRDDNSLLSLLHHIHQSLIGVMILPIQLYENVLLRHCHISSEDILEKFKECAIKEIKLVENFLQTAGSNKSLENGFRSDLAELEKQTDLLYLKIQNLNNC